MTSVTLAEIESQVIQLRADGFGDSRAHPHIPTVIVTPQGPALGWQAHCTASGCGTYVEDTTVEPPVDYLCSDCEDTDTMNEGTR